MLFKDLIIINKILLYQRDSASISRMCIFEAATSQLSQEAKKGFFREGSLCMDVLGLQTELFFHMRDWIVYLTEIIVH